MRTQWTFGKLLEALEKVDPELVVSYDWCNFTPSFPASYRGCYDHIAIGYTGSLELPVSEFLLSLKAFQQKGTMSGYKGGEYPIKSECLLWVANHGESTNTVITGVNPTDYDCIIETGYLPE